MRIIIAAIGSLKSGPELDLFQRYIKPMPWKISLKELETKKITDPLTRMQKEGELLLSACEGAGTLIALDEHGKNLRSIGFAQYLQKRMDAAAVPIAFVIGGADGLSKEILHKANLLLSFGELTWPHMLARAMLAEQLYRAHTILTGHPYHRE